MDSRENRDLRENVAFGSASPLFGSASSGSVASGNPKGSAERLYADNERLARAALSRDFKRLTPDQKEAAACYARVGLWNAAQTFDPRRGVAFSTYATHCIRGEVLHYLAWLKRQKNTPCISLDAPLGEDDDFTRLDLVPAGLASCPETALLESAGFDDLLSLVPMRLRFVLLKTFGEGETLQEVADMLGISRQRAHNLQQSGLQQIRTRLARRQNAEAR